MPEVHDGRGELDQDLAVVARLELEGDRRRPPVVGHRARPDPGELGGRRAERGSGEARATAGGTRRRGAQGENRSMLRTTPLSPAAFREKALTQAVLIR